MHDNGKALTRDYQATCLSQSS